MLPSLPSERRLENTTGHSIHNDHRQVVRPIHPFDDDVVPCEVWSHPFILPIGCENPLAPFNALADDRTRRLFFWRYEIWRRRPAVEHFGDRIILELRLGGLSTRRSTTTCAKQEQKAEGSKESHFVFSWTVRSVRWPTFYRYNPKPKSPMTLRSRSTVASSPRKEILVSQSPPPSDTHGPNDVFAPRLDTVCPSAGDVSSLSQATLFSGWTANVRALAGGAMSVRPAAALLLLGMSGRYFRQAHSGCKLRSRHSRTSGDFVRFSRDDVRGSATTRVSGKRFVTRTKDLPTWTRYKELGCG